MSLSASFPPRRRSSPRHLINALLIAALLLVLGLSYLYWQDFVQLCINMQIYMHRYLVLYLLQIQNGQMTGGLMLVAAGFIYGFLHSVGPGHGKFVITTYLSTSRETRRISRIISFCGSMMQGVVAIAFVWLLAVIFNFSMGDLSTSRWYVEKISALLIAVFGVVTLMKALGIRLRRTPARLKIRSAAFTTQHSSAARAYARPETTGCGHKHLPDEKELHGNWHDRLWVIATIGIRPCSGAILILIFANAIGLFRWGMMAAMSMALGTALSIMLMALAVTHARDRILALNAGGMARWQHAGRIMQAAGAILLILFAAVLFFAVIPVSANGDFVAAGC